MADDHKIRVIVEGVDQLSGTFKGARQDLEHEIDKLQKKLIGLKKDMQEATTFSGFGNSKTFKSSQTGQFTTYEKARLEVDRLRKSLRELRVEAAKANASLSGGGTGASGGSATQVGTPGFFRNLSKGFKEAQAAGDRLNKALSTAREDVKERRKAVDIETRAGQIRLNQVKADAEARLEGIIKARQAEIAATQDIAKLKHAYDDNARRKVKNDQVADLEFAARQAKQEANLREKLAREPISAEKAQLKRTKDAADPNSSTGQRIAALTQEQVALKKIRDIEVENVEKQLRVDVRKVVDDYDRAKLNADHQFQQQILKQNRDERSFVSSARERIATKAAQIQARFSASRLAAKVGIETPDDATARAREQELRRIENAAHSADSTFQKLGRSAGIWSGDLLRGIKEGRKGLVDFGSEAQKAESLMTRIGQSAGRAIGQFGNLVNLRWFLLTSALQVVGGLVVHLGAAFISLASSAAYAGAAIGSAFAAAASQALPVVGLLAAAASRVQAVFKAVQLEQQNKIDAATGQAAFIARRTASEQLADAQYSLAQSTISVSEANYQLKQSGLDIIDAQTRQKESELNLAEVRREVTRGIVDSYNNQKDAALDLRAAELAVVDAKRSLIEIEKQQKLNQADINAAKGAVAEAEQRLKAARAEGDKAAIANSIAQLAVARQSLSQVQITARTTNTAVKEAQLGVEQAQQREKEQRINKKRTDEDSRRTQRQGLLGNRQFIAAQREIKEATRAVEQSQHAQRVASQQVTAALHAEKIAQRELKDIEHDRKAGIIGTTPGKQQLKALLASFSPSERDLYQSLVKLQATYKKAFRPITDIIVEAISRAVDRGAKLLKDPKIQAAAKTLATAIGNGIDRISKFAVSPKVRKDLELFISNAAKNLPKVVDAILKLADAFLAIAKHGQPLFKVFIDFIDKVATKIDKFFNNKKKSDAFFGIAGKNLDAWVKLAKAVGSIFLALFKGSNSAGLKLVKDFTGFLNGIAKWLRDHPKKVEKFFNDSAKSLEKIAKALVPLGKELFKVFASKNSTDFIIFVIQIVIPGLLLLVTTMQKVISIFLALTHVPIIGHFIKIAAEFLVFEKALNRVFPISQKLTNLLKTGLASVFPKLVGGIKTVALAFKALLFTPPYIVAIIAGIIAIIILLDRKFHFLRPTIEAIEKVFKRVFNWIKDNWKELPQYLIYPFEKAWSYIKKVPGWITSAFHEVINWFKKHWKEIVEIMVAIFTFPIGPIAGIIWHFRDAIIGFFKDIIDWLRKHWKDITQILIAIFVPGGVILAAFWRWHKTIFNAVKGLVNSIVGFFEKMPGRIVSALTGISGKIAGTLTALPGKIQDLFVGIGKAIIDKIIDVIPGLRSLIGKAKKVGNVIKDVKKIATDPVGDAKKAIKFLTPATGGVVPIHAAAGHPGTPSGTDTVPAWLTPGEWVLNAQQQAALSSVLGTSQNRIREFLFGTTKIGVGPNPSSGIFTTARGAIKRAENFALTSTGGRLNSNYNAYSGPNYTLVPSADGQGNVIWFAQFGNGTYGQVSTLDANRILKTDGKWIPRYLKRVAGHRGGLEPGTLKKNYTKFTRGVHGLQGLTARNAFAFGGVVPKAQRLASGGPVVYSPAGKRGGNTVSQHFEVHTQGETDWNYVMRLGAVHAQESF